MGKTVVYINTQLYSNEKTLDGNPIEDGKVKAPIAIELYGLKPEDCVSDNLKTWRFGEFKYKIGFMGINEDIFDSYMHDFWRRLNTDMEMRREGRCVIGTNPDGSIKLCPNTHRCKGCHNKGLLERHNPKRVEILSLNYEFENEGFDTEDKKASHFDDQILDKMCPEPTYEEVRNRAIAYLEGQNARHAQIIKLELEGKSIDEICIAIKLQSSRGREVINEANDALCDYLKMPHMKTKHRK